MIGEGELRSGLAEHWGVADATVEAHTGGMNSATWFVTVGGERWVRPLVAAAVAAYGAVDPSFFSWGLLHCDPAPEAFRLDQVTGVCGADRLECGGGAFVAGEGEAFERRCSASP